MRYPIGNAVLRFFILALIEFAPPTSCLFIYGQRADNFPPDNIYVTFEETNLPIVMISVNGEMILKDTRITGRMKVINNPTGLNYPDTIRHPNQQVDYDGYIGLKYRGNSSFYWSDKKSYSIHLINDSVSKGSNVKSDIMGMGSDNDWVLIAPYQDRSMMRDVLTFELSRKYMDYVPECKYCELFLDGTYYGVYIMAEHIRRGKNRLDLQKPKDDGDALTGGYLLYVNDGNADYFVSDYYPVDSTGIEYYDREIRLEYADPDGDDITEPQKTYIQNTVRDFENAIMSGDYDAIQKHIDITSFIDFQLATELSNNSDGYRKSTYLYKYRDSKDPRFKLTIWDLNLAYGNFPNKNAPRTDVWRYKQNNTHYSENDKSLIPFWWYKLNTITAYTTSLKQRWHSYRSETYSTDKVNHKIDSLVSVLNSLGAQERNSLAWPRWGVPIHGSSYASESFDVEIDRLRDWISRRLEWMDAQLISTNGIHEVCSDGNNENYYSIYGVKLMRPRSGLVIVRNGINARKIICK